MLHQRIHRDAEDVKTDLALLGWSQNELARRIKVNPGYVSRLLRGQITSDPLWKRIQQAIGREKRRLVGRLSRQRSPT